MILVNADWLIDTVPSDQYSRDFDRFCGVWLLVWWRWLSLHTSEKFGKKICAHFDINVSHPNKMLMLISFLHLFIQKWSDGSRCLNRLHIHLCFNRNAHHFRAKYIDAMPNGGSDLFGGAISVYFVSVKLCHSKWDFVMHSITSILSSFSLSRSHKRASGFCPRIKHPMRKNPCNGSVVGDPSTQLHKNLKICSGTVNDWNRAIYASKWICRVHINRSQRCMKNLPNWSAKIHSNHSQSLRSSRPKTRFVSAQIWNSVQLWLISS